MSRLVTIRRNLSETAELLRRSEATLANDPATSDWIQHDIRSLQKLHRQLEREFASEAHSLQVDECRYRLFRDGDNPPLGPIASILGEFQHLVSLVYHAMDRKEPLSRGALDAAAISHTSFRIGYSFAGSIGFVLTLPNEERALTPEVASRVDEAIEAVFGLAQIRTSEQIVDAAQRYGRPIVRSCYRWAAHHVGAAVNSHVEWRRNLVPRCQMMVQHQEFKWLTGLIDEVSQEVSEEVTVTGVLTAANFTSRTFQFAIEDGEQIRGSFEDAISESQSARVPHPYTAHLRQTSSINYATDEVTTRYLLLNLERLPSQSRTPVA